MVAIQPVDDFRQARECVQIQRDVWGFAWRDLVTEEMLLGCARAGGIVLSATLEGRLVGFVFSLPAPLGPVVIQHSHMLAVRAEYRDRGVGQQLKWAQFERARQAGCRLITWTFDPLEARNAHLNLDKLGATAGRYYVDLYGAATSSGLHQGIGTDRLLAEWRLQSEAPRPLGGQIDLERALELPQALPTRTGGSRLRIPLGPVLWLKERRIALEIPATIQRVKRLDLELARSWRERSRQAFRHYLGRGYRARGLLLSRGAEGRSRRTFYVLEVPDGGDS